MTSKFGWEKGDIEIVKQPAKKAKSYAEAARLLAIVERAGARHSATDRALVQQLHDIAMELGAECYHDEGETLTADDLRRYAPNPMLKAAVEALVLRHPGHPNQKTHGNRFGAGQAKESLRRLKDDKGAREKYKATARKKLGTEAKPARKPGVKSKGDSAKSTDALHEEFKSLNNRFREYKFNFGSPEMHRLIEVERELIKRKELAS